MIDNRRPISRWIEVEDPDHARATRAPLWQTIADAQAFTDRVNTWRGWQAALRVESPPVVWVRWELSEREQIDERARRAGHA